MSKWINKSLEPIESPDVASDEHIEIEDLARMAEGNVSRAENERFTRHLNRCPRCYDILRETLSDLSRESSAQPASDSVSLTLWKRKTFYALAASFILIFLVGGQLIFKYVFQHPQRIISAAVDLDQNLKDILMEDESLRWEKGPRLDRLVAALQKKGHVFKNLNLVVLARPYYQKKSLFGPKEVLHIRVEDKVAYLEVKPQK